ncbi:hypothetical protein MXB_5117, partial [Myxobolus squamalis]
CEKEFDDIFEDKKCIASFKYNLTLYLNDTKLQKFNKKLHFKIFTTDLIQITAFVRILVYQHARSNQPGTPLTSTLSYRSIWLKKKCADYIVKTLNRPISDFSFFWADGLAFIAILNRYTGSNM